MYHTLQDYQDQNKNYSNTNHQNNYKAKANNNNNLNTMKKGVMVNGSEVYYGKGIKVDPSNKANKNNNNINNIKRINKKIVNNNTNKIGHNNQIQYVSKEEKIITNTVKVNKKEEKFEENLVDLSKPHCFISVRMYNGSVIKTEFNCDKKLRDVYSFNNNKHLWFSGRIRAYQAREPGSIPGGCNFFINNYILIIIRYFLSFANNKIKGFLYYILLSILTIKNIINFISFN